MAIWASYIKKIVQSGQARVVAILDKEQRRREEGLSDGYHVYSEKQLETFFKETMDLVIVATKIEERAYYATQARLPVSTFYVRNRWP